VNLKHLFYLIAGIVIINIIGNQAYSQMDLTEDRRYSLSSPVKETLQGLETSVNVRVFLTADFLPADYKLFKKSIIEKLDDFRGESKKISYFFEDPNKGELEEIRARGMALRNMGVNPVRVGKDQQGKDVYVFPAAVVEGPADTVVVNLMVNDIPGAEEGAVISNSISMLEYNLARGVYRASTKEKGVIAFSEGHGELPAGEVADLDRSLRVQGYAVGRLPLDKIEFIDPRVDVLLIAKPRLTFNDQSKFLIDQYIMQGGKVIWLIDRLTASLDSMLIQNRYTPYDYPLNLEDMLFKYGFRIQPNLVMDMECTSVKLVSGNLGNAAQMDVFPWYFHPATRPFSDNPIVKNLDRVNLRFASVIDTITTKKAYTKKTVLLRTSDKTLLKYSPIDLNFEFLREKPPVETFQKANLPLAVLAEGEFISAYEHNATSAQLAALKAQGVSQLKRSIPTKMLVVSDGDLIRNDYNPETQDIRSLGFDRVSGYTFANKDFIMNAIEYMLDDSGIVTAKNREVKLRMLDCNRAEAEETKWQIINILLPLAFLALFGMGYDYVRRRRFGN
jgi:gliding-associated putative ABC transporter substrate-binding component GldG